MTGTKPDYAAVLEQLAALHLAWNEARAACHAGATALRVFEQLQSRVAELDKEIIDQFIDGVENHPDVLSEFREAARLRAELESLKGRFGKLIGVARVYVTCDGQVRGDAYRDLACTVDQLADPELEDLYGWPACYARVERERNKLNAELGKAENRIAKLEAECELKQHAILDEFTDDV